MLPVGSPAIGDDFINREKEVGQILSSLKKDNVLLIAPRRFGKTSVMRRLEKELLHSDGISVFLEVEDVYTPQRFLAEIVTALIENVKVGKKTRIISALKEGFHWLTDIIEEVGTPYFKVKLRSKIEKDLQKDWAGKSELISELISGVESDIYFILDEFPVAIKNMKPNEAEKLLHWFRKLRQTSKNLRFIVGGSVSIDRVVREVGGISTINDFKRVSISGFKKKVVLDIIRKTFREEKWPYKPSIGKKILEVIGEPFIPYFVASMLAGIKEEKDLRGEIIDEDLIYRVYNFRLLGNEGKHYFEHYSQRLRIFYSPMEEKAARAILKEICKVEYYPIDHAFGIFKKETGIDDSEKFMDLLADLSHDFYIELDTERGQLRFYSKILKDWWRIYRGDLE